MLNYIVLKDNILLGDITQTACIVPYNLFTRTKPPSLIYAQYPLQYVTPIISDTEFYDKYPIT